MNQGVSSGDYVATENQKVVKKERLSKCKYCEKGHWRNECQKYLCTEDRKNAWFLLQVSERRTPFKKNVNPLIYFFIVVY